MREKNQTRSRARPHSAGVRGTHRPWPPRQAGAGIDPNLMAFVDRVVVPTLVQGYLAELRRDNQLVADIPTVAQCVTERTVTAEGKR